MASFNSRKQQPPGYYSSGGGGSEFSYAFPSVDQQQFESFDYGSHSPTPSQQSSFYDPVSGSNPYGGGGMEAPSSTPTYFVPPQPVTRNQNSEFDNNYEDELPLLEELGINPSHIMEKTLSVLNPLRTTDAVILQDTDLAGPVVFCVLFGFILLLTGKVHFGYIYGIGVIGCVGMYFLLNMMSVAGVSLGVTISVLGYCLLPMVGLAGVNLLLSLQGVIGIILTILSVLWCSLSASKLFVTALEMQKQQALVAYPCALVYGVFALLAVF